MGLQRDEGLVLFHLPPKGFSDPAPRPVNYASARSPRRRKPRAKAPTPPSPDRPTPAFSWHPWECSLRSLWNVLRFGTFWEFDAIRLLRHYGPGTCGYRACFGT